MKIHFRAASEAFVTLVASEAYGRGALVLAESLRQHGTTRNLVALVTPKISSPIRYALDRVFDEVCEVDVMKSCDAARLVLLQRPELGLSLTKLHCWSLTQYSKAVFMDADTMALSNIDELFEREEFSAAPDPAWPDCFNSGLFVFRPSHSTHAALLTAATCLGSFDGGDQGLLNTFFSDWATKDITHHLPFIFNLAITSLYTCLPAFRQFGSKARVIHFLGAIKPWHWTYHSQHGTAIPPDSGAGNATGILGPLVTKWWHLYENVIPLLEEGGLVMESPKEMTELPLASMSLPDQVSGALKQALVVSAMDSLNLAGDDRQRESDEHRRCWERGQIDYLGKDSFDNIQRKLDAQMK
uniref:glycogenin-1-like isoform X5 n=1 Tax=Myxine glutinosa TaxID=7769 RepID=UPI00358FB3D6